MFPDDRPRQFSTRKTEGGRSRLSPGGGVKAVERSRNVQCTWRGALSAEPKGVLRASCGRAATRDRFKQRLAREGLLQSRVRSDQIGQRRAGNRRAQKVSRACSRSKRSGSGSRGYCQYEDGGCEGCSFLRGEVTRRRR